MGWSGRRMMPSSTRRSPPTSPAHEPPPCPPAPRPARPRAVRKDSGASRPEAVGGMRLFDPASFVAWRRRYERERKALREGKQPPIKCAGCKKRIKGLVYFDTGEYRGHRAKEY